MIFIKTQKLSVTGTSSRFTENAGLDNDGRSLCNARVNAALQ